MDNKKFPIIISRLIIFRQSRLYFHFIQCLFDFSFLLWLEISFPSCNSDQYRKSTPFSPFLYTDEKPFYYFCGIYSIWVPATYTSHFLHPAFSFSVWWTYFFLIYERSFLRGTAMQYHSHIEAGFLSVPMDCTSFIFFTHLSGLPYQIRLFFCLWLYITRWFLFCQHIFIKKFNLIIFIIF